MAGLLTEYRVGALSVFQEATDKEWVNRQLRRIDPDLFLEQQIVDAPDGATVENVWCVVQDTHREEERLITVLEWRDPLGRPIPVPSEGIVREMEKRRYELERGIDAVELGRQAKKRNDERVARLKADQRDGHEELLREFARLAKRSPTVHRSRGLQMSRARKRARGIPDGQ